MTTLRKGVAGLVIARVERDASGAAPLGGLLRRHDVLGAGEQAAGRDPGGDERVVVRAAVERGGLGLAPDRGEEVNEDVFNHARAGRAGGRGVRRIAVVQEPARVSEPTMSKLSITAMSLSSRLLSWLT